MCHKILKILLNNILFTIITNTNDYIYNSSLNKTFTKVRVHAILVDDLHNRFTDNENT